MTPESKAFADKIIAVQNDLLTVLSKHDASPTEALVATELVFCTLCETLGQMTTERRDQVREAVQTAHTHTLTRNSGEELKAELERIFKETPHD